MEFLVVVPVYNASHWIERCLESLRRQSYRNFRCLVINDASTDDTADRLHGLAWLPQDSRFQVRHNPINLSALPNVVAGFRELGGGGSPESIFTVLDGDDWLFSELTLEMVAAVYAQSDCWLTYGDFVTHPQGERSFCRALPQTVVERNLFRQYPFITSQLRTFKCHLFAAIRDEDLRDDSGNYFTVTYDCAVMFPMLEMAAERIRYVENILYVYNRINPISDDRIRGVEQKRVEAQVRKRRRYERRPD